MIRIRKVDARGVTQQTFGCSLVGVECAFLAGALVASRVTLLVEDPDGAWPVHAYLDNGSVGSDLDGTSYHVEPDDLPELRNLVCSAPMRMADH